MYPIQFRRACRCTWRACTNCVAIHKHLHCEMLTLSVFPASSEASVRLRKLITCIERQVSCCRERAAVRVTLELIVVFARSRDGSQVSILPLVEPLSYSPTLPSLQTLKLFHAGLPCLSQSSYRSASFATSSSRLVEVGKLCRRKLCSSLVALFLARCRFESGI